MKLLTSQQHKEMMLPILIQFADFCDKNNLAYFLYAGTLLGAVRHKGFIPWDDDIDVVMPRKDYETFLKLTGGKLDKFEVIHYSRTDNVIVPFIKIINPETILKEKTAEQACAIGIDLFPLDGMPANKIKQAIHSFRIFISKGITGTFTCNLNLKTKIKKILTLIIKKLHNNKLRAMKKQDNLSKKYSYENSLYVTNTLWNATNSKREIFPKEAVDGFTKLEFEGKLFKAPKNYDAVLKALFGNNYMQPPPENKRKNHEVEVYLR